MSKLKDESVFIIVRVLFFNNILYCDIIFQVDYI